MAATLHLQGNDIRVEIESGSATGGGPARVRIYEGDAFVAEVVGTISREEGDGMHTTSASDDATGIPPWKWVMHHDDPPCKARLRKDGYCAKCGLHPDTQSKALWPYCPKCDKDLNDGSCAACGTEYRKPD